MGVVLLVNKKVNMAMILLTNAKIAIQYVWTVLDLLKMNVLVAIHR
jgi:hypothetical protein